MLETEIASSKCKKQKCWEPKLSLFVLPINLIQTISINKQMQSPKRKRSCAVVAKPFYENQQRQRVTQSNKIYKIVLWRVLLDSGSDGDLITQQKGKKNSVP